MKDLKNYYAGRKACKSLVPIVITFILVLFSDCKKAEKIIQPQFNISMQSPDHIRLWKLAYFNTGDFAVSDSLFILKASNSLTGIVWQGEFPKINYEFTCQAMRVNGNDFFAGISFPVKNNFCTWINGGWGGTVVGLSNVDWSPASENLTTTHIEFQNNNWYALKLQVTATQITAWIDKEQVIELKYTNHSLSLHSYMETLNTLSLASWQTTAYFKNIKLVSIPADSL